jgi:hypothetical protein
MAAANLQSQIEKYNGGYISFKWCESGIEQKFDLLEKNAAQLRITCILILGNAVTRSNEMDAFLYK